MNLLSMTDSTKAIVIMAIIFAVAITLITIIITVTCYKKCPSDKIMVIYGKVGKRPDGSPCSAICIHGGARMIWPFVQSYEFLSLKPISIPINLKRALSEQNNHVDISANFTVGISVVPELMQNAAERLLGLSTVTIASLAHDIILGQLRLTVSHTDIEDTINSHDKLLDKIARNVETEIKKIGLWLINLDIADVVIH